MMTNNCLLEIWQKVNFLNVVLFSIFFRLCCMYHQVINDHIQDKNEEEISKMKLYIDVYRKMVSQMAKNSQEEYF